MADSAFQIQYRQEFIAQFEQGASWLRTICTTEAAIKGNQAMFLVAGSGTETLNASGASSGMKCPQSSPSPRTSVAHNFHTSNVALPRRPRAPHTASDQSRL